MTREKTKIDNLIEPAVEKVARRAGGRHFWKSSIVNEVVSNKGLAPVLADLRKHYGPWKFHDLIMRHIEILVGRALQQRDANKMRIYECYAAGEPEQRWQTLRAMTADGIRHVMQRARREKVKFARKETGYGVLLEELEKLGQPNATVDEVYDRAMPKIRALRESGGRKAQVDTFFDDLLSE